MAAEDDFLNSPPDQGFPADVDPASPYSGNRPASGARRATPGEVLSQGFLGAQNAGDFLGLDTEFAGSQDPNQYGQGSPLDLVPPPTIQQPDPSLYPAEAVAPAPLPDGDAVQEFAQAPSAFEFGEDLGTEEGELPLEPEPTRSKMPLFAGALALAALAAGGVLYGPRLYSHYFGSGTKGVELAKTPPVQPKGKVGEAPVAPKAEPVAPEAVAAVPEPAAPPSKPQTAVKEPLAEPAVPGLVPRRTPEPELLALDPDAAGPDAAEPVEIPSPLGAPRTGPVQAKFPDLGGPEYAWASVDLLELIWRGSEVPLEAVRGPAKTLMPKVGTVRVFTTTGDVFDGRLYAVGQNRVWIDAEPGRVGLDGDKVERIEVLPPLPEGQQNGEPTLAVGGKHVRVRVPGGTISGRVLKTEGDEVTLALDDGGRVRVKTTDVQELGSGRAIVVRR